MIIAQYPVAGDQCKVGLPPGNHVHAILGDAAADGWVGQVDVVFDRGVYLPGLDLWLDALRKQELSVISHAHSDHTARHRRPVLTPGTELLLGDYLRRSESITLGLWRAAGISLPTPSRCIRPGTASVQRRRW